MRYASSGSMNLWTRPSMCPSKLEPDHSGTYASATTRSSTWTAASSVSWHKPRFRTQLATKLTVSLIRVFSQTQQRDRSLRWCRRRSDPKKALADARSGLFTSPCLGLIHRFMLPKPACHMAPFPLSAIGQVLEYLGRRRDAVPNFILDTCPSTRPSKLSHLPKERS